MPIKLLGLKRRKRNNTPSRHDGIAFGALGDMRTALAVSEADYTVRLIEAEEFADNCASSIGDVNVEALHVPANVRSHRRALPNVCKARRLRARPCGLRC